MIQDDKGAEDLVLEALPPPEPGEQESSKKEWGTSEHITTDRFSELREGALELTAESVPWHRIDYRAGMLLAQIDGQRRWTEIYKRSGLDEETAALLLKDLISSGLVSTR